MAKLTAKARKQIKPSNFALPGGRYPIEDKAHARNAKARVAQHGTPEEKKKVDAAVARKYPGIGKEKPVKKLAKKDEMKRGAAKRMSAGMQKLEKHKAKMGRHKAIGSHEGYIKLK